MNAQERKKITGGPEQAQQDAGLRVQPARDTLQDRQQAGSRYRGPRATAVMH